MGAFYRNGQFLNEGGSAFIASSSKINGSIYFDDGFKANGEVRLIEATIEGSVYCEKAEFNNIKNRAFSADGLCVKGMFLGRNCLFLGEVRLLSAIIGKNLDLGNSQFKNQESLTINAKRLKVGGDVYACENFRSQGTVSFASAMIEGDFKCSKGHFQSTQEKAVSLDQIRINGDLLMNDGFHAEGSVSLQSAVIGMDLNCNNSEFKKNDMNEFAFVADQMAVGGKVGLYHSKFHNHYSTLGVH